MAGGDNGPVSEPVRIRDPVIGRGCARLWGGRAVVRLPQRFGGLRDARGRAGRRLRGGPPPAPAPRADHGEPRRDQHGVAQADLSNAGIARFAIVALALLIPWHRPAVRPPRRTSSGSLWRTAETVEHAFEYTYLVVVTRARLSPAARVLHRLGRLPELAGGHRFRHDRPAVRERERRRPVATSSDSSSSTHRFDDHKLRRHFPATGSANVLAVGGVRVVPLGTGRYAERSGAPAPRSPAVPFDSLLQGFIVFQRTRSKTSALRSRRVSRRTCRSARTGSTPSSS